MNGQYLTAKIASVLSNQNEIPFGANGGSIRIIEQTIRLTAINSNGKKRNIQTDWYLLEDAEKLQAHFVNQEFKVKLIPCFGSSVPMSALDISWK